MLNRLYAGWVYGGVLAGLLLLGLTPVLTSGWTLAQVLTFATLPVYMLHQYEEHDDDRFRRFVNRFIAGGVEALTLRDVFVINIGGVWLVLGIVIAMARLDAGWGVLAAYLVVVNAVAHIGPALAMRRANPGLVTAVLLFLPVGGWLLAELRSVATPAQQGVGLVLAVGLHALIILHVKRKVGRVLSPTH